MTIMSARHEKYCNWIENNMPHVDAHNIREKFKEHDENSIEKVLQDIFDTYDQVVMDDLCFVWGMLGSESDKQELEDLLQTRDEDMPAFSLRMTQTALRLHPPDFYHCCRGCDDQWCRCCAGVCGHS